MTGSAEAKYSRSGSDVTFCRGFLQQQGERRPATSKTLTVKISGGTGDADLYTQFNAHPTSTSYACRPFLGDSNETCTHANAAAGTWYVMVRGFSAYSGVTLIGSY